MQTKSSMPNVVAAKTSFIDNQRCALMDVDRISLGLRKTSIATCILENHMHDRWHDSLQTLVFHTRRSANGGVCLSMSYCTGCQCRLVHS